MSLARCEGFSARPPDKLRFMTLSDRHNATLVQYTSCPHIRVDGLVIGSASETIVVYKLVWMNPTASPTSRLRTLFSRSGAGARLGKQS